jgi:hypothetical protein
MLADYYGSHPAYTDYDYNAYTNAANPFPIGGSHDVGGVAFNWQASWLGDFYLPSDSILIDAGSVTADAVGLYHFTTQTNEYSKEEHYQVDIGYHYVGVDWQGKPLAENGGEIADYLMDTDGDGLDTESSGMPPRLQSSSPILSPRLFFNPSCNWKVTVPNRCPACVTI